jgi:hypothetical protein
MDEISIVRQNLMNENGYTPYCGNISPRDEKEGCDNPRTKFNGHQFICPKCAWVSAFSKDFIKRYKEKWNK